jgi:hypothetical protein
MAVWLMASRYVYVKVQPSAFSETEHNDRRERRGEVGSASLILAYPSIAEDHRFIARGSCPMLIETRSGDSLCERPSGLGSLPHRAKALHAAAKCRAIGAERMIRL